MRTIILVFVGAVGLALLAESAAAMPVSGSMFVKNPSAKFDQIGWRRGWHPRWCYEWGYFGWRPPYCGAMGGFYYPWGPSYYLAPRPYGGARRSGAFVYPFD